MNTNKLPSLDIFAFAKESSVKVWFRFSAAEMSITSEELSSFADRSSDVSVQFTYNIGLQKESRERAWLAIRVL